MILSALTEFGLSLALPTEKFCSWALPTLRGGIRIAAQPAPPSATNRARNDTTSGAEGRRRRSERGLIESPPGLRAVLRTLSIRRGLGETSRAPRPASRAPARPAASP